MAFVGKVSDVPPGRLLAVELDGEPLAVANVDGLLYAIGDVCTHRGCSLSEGQLSGAVLTCRCHGGQFDVRTGEVLTSVPLFAGLDAREVEVLAGFTFRKTFEAGELIVEEGRTGNGLFVIVSGSAEVIKGLGTAHPRTVARRGAGDPIGEMALLGEWPRSASVRASETTECLGIDRWIFLDHLEKKPKLALRLLQVLALRLAETAEWITE